ncbi:DNA endonuclease [Desmonostoc muscorum CCALA 125]|nr:DNA endonuclease [Desmonostoc muscorum CCALA 125]
MRQPFHCLVCGKKVELGLAHQACRHTCGSAECQAVYQKRYSAQVDQYRQRNRIKQLQLQGVDMVTCALCHQQFEMIHHSHLKKHGLTVKQYKRIYPNLPTLNSRTKQTRGQGALTQSHYLNYIGKEPDKKLYQFLTGSLLGDGYLEKASNKRNARYVEGGGNQKYLDWKNQFISQYFSCSFNERLSSPHTKTGKQYQGWWLKTKVHPVFTELHSQWYCQKKVIPQRFILQYLTEFALTIWFCDDGCSTHGIRFYTMAFSADEVKFLATLLKSRFGLQGSILKNQKNQPFINLDADSRRKFRKITSQFLIPGMEYKLNF